MLTDLSSAFVAGEGLAGEMATEGVWGWFSRSAAEGVRCAVSTREGVGVDGAGGSGFGVDTWAPVDFSPRGSALCLELGRASAFEALPWLDPVARSCG